MGVKDAGSLGLVIKVLGGQVLMIGIPGVWDQDYCSWEFKIQDNDPKSLGPGISVLGA